MATEVGVAVGVAVVVKQGQATLRNATGQMLVALLARGGRLGLCAGRLAGWPGRQGRGAGPLYGSCPFGSPTLRQFSGR